MQRAILLLIGLLVIFPRVSSAQIEMTIWEISWNPSGTMLAISGSFEGNSLVKLFDEDGEFIDQIDPPFGVQGISWRPDGAQLATYGGVGYTLWEIPSGTPLVTIEQSGATADDSVYWNPTDFNQIATIETKFVHLRDASTGAIWETLDGQGGNPDSVLGVGWHPGGGLLYTVSTEAVIRVWDAATGVLLEEHLLQQSAEAFAMNANGTLLAIAHSDGVIRIYSAETGQLFKELSETPPPAFSDNRLRGNLQYIEWSDNSSAILGTNNLGVYLWNVESGIIEKSVPRPRHSSISPRSVEYRNGSLIYPESGGTIIKMLVTHAGVDQFLIDGNNNNTKSAALDGSGSTNYDGTIASYPTSNPPSRHNPATPPK